MLNAYLFRVILIPGGVFVSVMFGGGAATGLEITTYMSSNGPVGGLVAIGIIALMFVITIFFVFEIGRLYGAYDYQSFGRVILGSKAWVLYEIAITLSMFGVLAYSTTGAGTAMADEFGLPRVVMTASLLIVVVLLTFLGRQLIELTMLGTMLLLLACSLSLVSGAALAHSEEIATQLRDFTIEMPVLVNKVWTYTVFAVAFIPIILYAARDLRTRPEVFAASVASGIAIMLPPLGMHLAYLSRYPAVLNEEIPNAWIAAEVMPKWFSSLFVIVLSIVILQTAVGIVQGIIERLDSWSLSTNDRSLGKLHHAIIAAVLLVACLGLSGFGVQRILGWMYNVSFWLYLVIFFFPLAIVGGYRIWTAAGTVQVRPK